MGSLSALARFVLTTVGTTGDVVPHVALARALTQRGHAVVLATHSFHRDFALAHQVEHASVGPPASIAEFNALVDEAAKEPAPIRQFGVLVRRFFLREPARQLADLAPLVRAADLVVAQRFDYLGQEAAIAAGRPWASVTLAPQLIPTREGPVYPAPSLGAWWNRFTWITLGEMAKPINAEVLAVLTAAGACPRRLDVAGAASPRLDLVAVSPHLGVARGDWPPATEVTGAWFLDDPGYVPDPELAEFFARHPAPIVIGFGSMGGLAAGTTERLVLDALLRLGRPAIVQRGYAGLLARGDAPKNVLAVGHVPHDYLLPRAGVVVHHAGAGTSHAVARAGVPSVPVPHLFDQYYWAGRLHDVGVAPRPVFRHHLTAKKLAERIDEAPAFVAPARRLAELVRAEAGADRAVRALEALLASSAS